MIKESCNLDWARAFWPVTCEAEFFQTGFCSRKQRIARSFISGYFQRHVMTKFYENQDFLSIIGQTFFFGKFTSVTFFVSKFLSLCKISKKTNTQILRKIGYKRPYVWTSMNS